jgi:hypothetical protein
MRCLRLLPSVLCLPLLAACGGDPAPEVGAPEDAAFALLAALDAGAVAEAYRRLDRYAYTVELRLTEENAEGRRQAVRRLARRRGPAGGATRVVASEGDFDEEAWGASVADPLPRLLPDEPPFLAPQSREQYRYTVGPDTVVSGRRLRVVEARLRPEAAEEQALRRVRYFLAPGSYQVLGVEVERASTSALFDEAGRAAVYLLPGPGGAPVPALAVAETTVDVPGEPPRRLRLEQRFSDVRAE